MKMDPNPITPPDTLEPGSPVASVNSKHISSPEAKPGGWVKFEDESGSSKGEGEGAVAVESVDSTPKRVVRPRPEDFSPVPEKEHAERTNQPVAAVISAETTHVNVSRSSVSRSPSKPVDTKIDLHTVNLRETNGTTSTNTSAGIIRQGFANGDIIVTLLPVNTRFPWITPAQFRPELVPEELMAQGLTLTVEDYVHIMELLTNDVRFHAYNICYKRILVVWILTAFIVLLSLLFSGVTGLTLFGLGVMWLVLNAAAIFLCMWVKIKLNYNLERCMAAVNKHLLRHKIILGLDDRGKLSCHKVNLCFIYFDTTDCIKKLQEVIEREEREGRPVNREETTEERRQRLQFQHRMDIEDNDIIIQGSQTTRVSRKQERAELLLLRYSSRWVKQLVRRRLELAVDVSERTGATFPPPPPRHCATSRCPCQFIEEHLKYKPRDTLYISPKLNGLHFHVKLVWVCAVEDFHALLYLTNHNTDACEPAVVFPTYGDCSNMVRKGDNGTELGFHLRTPVVSALSWESPTTYFTELSSETADTCRILQKNQSNLHLFPPRNVCSLKPR